MNMFFNNEINKSIFQDNVFKRSGWFNNHYTMFSMEYPNDIQWNFNNRLKRVASNCFKSKPNYYNYTRMIQLSTIALESK